MATVYRLVFAGLLAVVLLATTGIPSVAAAAAQAECCDEDCDEPQCPRGGECPPLCTACVCGASYAPLPPVPDILPQDDPIAIGAPIAPALTPDDPPARGVFHPPRLAA